MKRLNEVRLGCYFYKCIKSDLSCIVCKLILYKKRHCLIFKLNPQLTVLLLHSLTNNVQSLEFNN